MSKLRRFAIDKLEPTHIGGALLLAPDETRHARVLRLQEGDTIELFDPIGNSATGSIIENSARGICVRIATFQPAGTSKSSVKLILATAWPKGKRASVLVEKCAELGVDELVPVRYERSVVTKDEEAEGVARLRRIAAEASKQCGRDGVMTISAETAFADFLTRFAHVGTTFLLHPDADRHLVEALGNMPEQETQLTFLIGPEGGMSPAEIALASRSAVGKVRLAGHVLRIETAGIAAAAICRACLAT